MVHDASKEVSVHGKTKHCSAAFQSGLDWAVAFHPPSVAHSDGSRMDQPNECSKSCCHFQQASRAGCTPLHSSPLTSQFAVAVATRKGHDSGASSQRRACRRVVRAVQPLSVLCSERSHRRCVVLFPTPASLSVHSHPEGTSDPRNLSAGAEHARCRSCAQRVVRSTMQDEILASS